MMNESERFEAERLNRVERTNSGAPITLLALRLKRLRLQRGWNMDRVASSAGISRTTLFHLERSEIDRPRASTLLKLARVFGVPIESLHGGEVESSEWGVRNEECGIISEPGNSRPIPHSSFRTSNFPLPAPLAFDRATNPVVTQVAVEEPELFSGWSSEEWDELYSQFATGGALREEGVRQTAARINHDREVLYRLRVILQTHLAEVASGMVDTLYKLVSVESADGSPGDLPSDKSSHVR